MAESRVMSFLARTTLIAGRGGAFCPAVGSSLFSGYPKAARNSRTALGPLRSSPL